MILFKLHTIFWIEELKKMYNWIKPEIVIPVHGEYHHLKGNVEIAKKCGIKTGLILKNGLLLKIAPGEPKVIGAIPSGRLMLDGKKITPINEEAIKNRKKMLYNGTILISLALNKDNKIISQFGTTFSIFVSALNFLFSITFISGI